MVTVRLFIVPRDGKPVKRTCSAITQWDHCVVREFFLDNKLADDGREERAFRLCSCPAKHAAQRLQFA
ncbi:MAG: hypothetical protein ACREHD_12465 [Pirellulales bacterium]